MYHLPAVRVDLAVDRASVEDLLAAAPACVAPAARGAIRTAIAALVDVGVAAEQARRFKVDVQFALGGAGARFSLNDKGEEAAWRKRVWEASRRIRVPAAAIDGFFDLSPPGAVQTTIALKWGPRGGRPLVSLYFEELLRSAAGPGLVDRVLAPFSRRAPPPAGGVPAAVCLDFHDGRVVAGKDYWSYAERPGAPMRLPGALRRFLDLFPFHPVHGSRSFMLARRFTSRGLAGHKLLWRSEAQDAATAAAARATVDRVRARLRVPDSAPGRALDALIAGWRHESFLYPDLVALNTDAAGRPEGLLVYLSIK